jgi:hypothetical protein
MASCHRIHRNQRLRKEILEFLLLLPDGKLIRTADLASKLSKRISSVNGRCVGRLLSEHNPDLIEHAGNGHWIRRVKGES